ncbi:LysM peptidoglycan-binding domain-containing protein [Phycicoccus sp. Soil803]|uniref:LysM peptidoglycan-binding domain-containing protein n=1 Tax=Phycicoccus sp. Soil803 TaxID=1736415 RepID=UPI000AFC16C9|nr:LysM peptidoglycan-binding domain-containing protein [Phycicoccus sp. Soil803]
MDATTSPRLTAPMEDQMSAAVAWDVAPAPVRVPVRPARPQLVSLPTGTAVPEVPAAPLRITRAGRLALTLTVVVAAVALAVALFSGGASATVIDHSTTVGTGQTLSEIATQQLPQLPMAEAVAQLQIANDLTGSDIHAGQTLLIPRVG